MRKPSTCVPRPQPFPQIVRLNGAAFGALLGFWQLEQLQAEHREPRPASQ